jgi:hypothetical protein
MDNLGRGLDEHSYGGGEKMATKTTKIDAVEVQWADGTATTFRKAADGSWKADGITALGPQGLLDHIAMWVENSYREEGR